MKNEKELYTAILNITMKIKTQFPELSMYIMEMPVTVPNVKNPKINREVLQDYFDSLSVLLRDYFEYQTKIGKLV
jgi:hypothetical protein